MSMANIPHQEMIIQLLTVLFPEATIYLFGSYARGDFKESSDIDIAIDNKDKIPTLMIARAKNVIDALNVPQNIDMVDFQRVPDAMRTEILKDGIVWKK